MSVISEVEKAKIRSSRYAAGSLINVLGPALAGALLYGGVDKWIALAIAVLSLFTGSTVGAVAATKTKQQIGDGHFDQPAEVDPVQAAKDAFKQVADRASSSKVDLDAVTQAAASVLPGLIVAGADGVEKAISEATRRTS